MESLFIIFPLTLIAVISLYLGNLISLHLPTYNKFFDRKPFNCRPCATFHITWILCTLYGMFISCELFIIIGFTMSFALFSLTKYIDNKKIEK